MWHKVVLSLLVLSNILNCFMDRGGENGGRGIILVINGLVLVIALGYIFIKKRPQPLSYRSLYYFLFMSLLYFAIASLFPNKYFVMGQYVRLIANIGLFFFFSFFTANRHCDYLFKIYIITFIAECAIKIINGNAFMAATEVDTKMGGDIASMGLALVVPLLFMYFKEKQAFVLYVVCFVFALLSLRRTSILAIVLSLPFVWSFIKQHINIKSILVGLIGTVYVIYKAWSIVGVKLLYRFMEYSDGSSQLESYGSGRTEFWKYLINTFFHKGNYLLGNGFGSVYEAYSNGWYLALVHAHNDILEITFTFGFIGVFLWIKFWFSTIKSNYNSAPSKNKRLVYCAIVLYLFVAFTSGCILRAELFPQMIALSLLTRKQYDNVDYSYIFLKN